MMLAKQLSVSKRAEAIISYLFGPGTHNEHSNQRIIAGSSIIVSHAVFDLSRDAEARVSLSNELNGSWRQVRREQGLSLRAGMLDRGRGAAKAEHLFHATLSLSKDEGVLDDEQWGRASRMFVKKMGFIDFPNFADCSWLAVHHGASREGNDHVHIVVNLVREDGRKANIHQSKRRTAKVGAEIAKAMGLRSVFENERSSGIGNVSRAELERAKLEDRDVDRRLIRRKLASMAWNAESEADFVRRVRAGGLLIRPRFAKGGEDLVVGYSVALSGGGKPVWFAPSKLDRSLGLSILRDRYKWIDQNDAVSVWRDSGDRVAKSSMRMISVDDLKQIQMKLPYGDVTNWRGAAHDVGAIISTYALEVEGNMRGTLSRASDALSQAAQNDRGESSEVIIQSTQTLFSMALAGNRSATTGSAVLLMQMINLLDSMQQRFDAEMELEKSRRQFDQAFENLTEDLQWWAKQARAETFSSLPDDARTALAIALPEEHGTYECGNGKRAVLREEKIYKRNTQIYKEFGKPSENER